MVRCVALLSGGLDSILAIKIMQQQGIDVEALNFKTMFTCCQDESAQAARKLNVRLTVLSTEADYLDLIKRPQFGYGKGANPCVDCRIYMFQRAKQYMDQVGAQFIVSGEVVGQRPMSQKRKDLNLIAHRSELEDLLLRPLSARVLPPTKPEREGMVDRQQLYDFVGRSRKGLIELAREFGIDEIPTPSTGCALTEPGFGRKVFDLIRLENSSSTWDYEVLKIGRHFRRTAHSKVIVGRNKEENSQLEYYHQVPDASSQALLTPTSDFFGPAALLTGPPTSEAIAYAAGLVLRFSKLDGTETTNVRVTTRDGEFTVLARLSEEVTQAETVATP